MDHWRNRVNGVSTRLWLFLSHTESPSASEGVVTLAGCAGGMDAGNTDQPHSVSCISCDRRKPVSLQENEIAARELQ
jgi:hypothetical protein